MEEKRIVCIGTSEPLTRPGSLNPENGRFYRYPTPGKIHTWGGDSTAFVETDLPEHELVATYPGGPPIQGYGLLVLGDTYKQILRVTAESDFGALRQRGKDFEMKIEYAHERAAGIIEAWQKYGSLIIAGRFPSPEELEKARGLRRAYAENLLLRADYERKSGRHPVPSPVERAWAREFGLVLADTLESRPKAKLEVIEDTPCFACKMPVSAEATLCRYCQTRFGMKLADYLKVQTVEAEQVAAPEPRRGPGRPRKELVEVE